MLQESFQLLLPLGTPSKRTGDSSIPDRTSRQLPRGFSASVGGNYEPRQSRTGDSQLTRRCEILEDILKDEDRHIDDIEARQDQIRHMTLPVFLSIQVG